MAEKFIPWDPVKYIHTKEDICHYFEAAVDEDYGDGKLIKVVLGNIARAMSENHIKHDLAMSGEEISQTLSEESSLSFATLSSIAGAFGMKLTATTVENPPNGVVYRKVGREEAQGEILDLLASEPDMCYDDISDRLRIELEVVVDICLDLEDTGGFKAESQSTPI